MTVNFLVFITCQHGKYKLVTLDHQDVKDDCETIFIIVENQVYGCCIYCFVVHGVQIDIYIYLIDLINLLKEIFFFLFLLLNSVYAVLPLRQGTSRSKVRKRLGLT